jgi:hypothetical protein
MHGRLDPSLKRKVVLKGLVNKTWKNKIVSVGFKLVGKSKKTIALCRFRWENEPRTKSRCFD